MHVVDRWTAPGPAGKRVRTDRWGKGLRWRARWTGPDGHERSKACATRDEAHALLAQLRVDLAAGTYINPTAGAVTFREYAEQWRRLQLHHRPRTAEQAESRLRVHAYPTLGHRPLSSLRRSDIQAWVAGLQLAPATVEVVYGYVATVLRAAVDDRLIPVSPCTRISRPEVLRSRVVPLTAGQVEQIRQAVPARWRAMVVLAAASGLRSSELRGLTVDRLSPPVHVRGDIVPAQVTLRVDRQLASSAGGRPVWGPPKTPAADRLVPVGWTASRALAEHLAEFGPGRDGLVFSSRRGWALGRGSAGDAWRVGAAGLGLGGRSGWHDLRHFHASLLIADGLSVRAVADRLGHADPAETLRTYSHMWPTDSDRAVAAVERYLAGDA